MRIRVVAVCVLMVLAGCPDTRGEPRQTGTATLTPADVHPGLTPDVEIVNIHNVSAGRRDSHGVGSARTWCRAGHGYKRSRWSRLRGLSPERALPRDDPGRRTRPVEPDGEALRALRARDRVERDRDHRLPLGRIIRSCWLDDLTDPNVGNPGEASTSTRKRRTTRVRVMRERIGRTSIRRAPKARGGTPSELRSGQYPFAAVAARGNPGTRAKRASRFCCRDVA